MKGRKKRWPSPERIDVPGLRAVENRMEKLGALAKTVFEDVVPGWEFLIVAVEFSGGGLSYMTSSRERPRLIEKVRHHAQRLRDREPSPGVEIADAEEGLRPHALFETQVDGLAIAVPAVTRLIDEAMPPGWGFALLLYSPRSDQIVYTCDADRADMAQTLAEFADRLEADEDRGPGVVGTFH